MSLFQHKVVVITGGSDGIGKALVEAFLVLGAKVATCGRNYDKLYRLQSSHPGMPLLIHATDVSKESDCNRFIEEVIKQFGTIDILINNAGITQDARLIKMTEAQFDSVIDVNLKGVFNCTQLVVPHMLEAGSGAIVNASSVVGLYGNFGQTNYSATKFGVIGFTKTWARELGPKGIRVNAVCPGFIATEMVKAMPENILQDIERRSWLGRLGAPEEMANVYLFLASEEASYVNGVALEASGGISL